MAVRTPYSPEGDRGRGESLSNNSPFGDDPSFAATQTRPLLSPSQTTAASSPAERPYYQYDEEGQKARVVSMPMPMEREESEGGGGSAKYGYAHAHVRGGSTKGSQSFLGPSPYLAFADGDVPNNKLSKFYHYLLGVSIVTRWFLYIAPVLGALWIPGILGFTSFPDKRIYGVKLLFWSIWLSVVWLGWWGSLATWMLSPRVLRHTVGIIIVDSRKYIDWFDVLYRYGAFFTWSLVCFVSYGPLINSRQQTDDQSSIHTIDTVSKLLLGLLGSSALLFAEKISIQWVAGKFHERSYAERIEDQRRAIRVLATLYEHSKSHHTRRDGTKKSLNLNPSKMFQAALKGVRNAATSTTTILGNVASEIAGTSVLQPNSPLAIVKTALTSERTAKELGQRLFYSFARGQVMLSDDIARFFSTREEAEIAFAIFDTDANGDISEEEMEMAVLEIYREEMSIENSMRDLDSAVGRLDNILMTVYFFVVIIIFAIMLDTQVVTLVTGAGTLVLGLSWLIGSSLAEVLTSIIFLFIKHPYDVGDRVTIGKDTYTVKEIRLLSTIFLDHNSCSVQAPNTVLNGVFIYNYRRSKAMSETFEFEVEYSTSIRQIERLRLTMAAFQKQHGRDFQQGCDIAVVDMPGQTKLMLRTDIKYKSNWQQNYARTRRRNIWLGALKDAMLELKIYGPSGPPAAILSQPTTDSMTVTLPAVQYTLVDRDRTDDEIGLYEQRSDQHLLSAVDAPSRPGPTPSMPYPVAMPVPTTTSGSDPKMEEIELQTPRSSSSR